MLRECLAIAAVLGLAVTPVSAQKPGNASPGKGLENQLRRFENLPGANPGQGPNGLGVFAPGPSGNHGAQISSSRIPESVRERRNEVLSRRFSKWENRQELRDRIHPGAGKPLDAGQPKFKAGGDGHPGGGQSPFVSHGQNRRAYTHAERLLAKRLEQIDRLRDQYLETGDSRLLEQADKLEKLAQEQYQFRLDGLEPPAQGPKPLSLAPPSAETEPAAPAAPAPVEAP